MNSRVKLEVLFGPTSVCSDLWATAVEKLAIGLSRDRFCVVRVPELYGTLFKAALLGVDTPALVSSPGCSAIKYRGGGDNYVLDAVRSPETNRLHGLLHGSSAARPQ